MKFYDKNMVCFNNKLPVQILTLIHKYTFQYYEISLFPYRSMYIPI